jgi:hypothetical protein
MITSREKTKSIWDEIIFSTHPIEKLIKKKITDKTKLERTMNSNW